MSIKLTTSVERIFGDFWTLAVGNDEDGNPAILDTCDEVYATGTSSELHSFLAGIVIADEGGSINKRLGRISYIEYAITCSQLEGRASDELRMDVADQVAALCLGYAGFVAASRKKVGCLLEIGAAIYQAHDALQRGYQGLAGIDPVQDGQKSSETLKRFSETWECFEEMQKQILPALDEKTKKVVYALERQMSGKEKDITNIDGDITKAKRNLELILKCKGAEQEDIDNARNELNEAEEAQRRLQIDLQNLQEQWKELMGWNKSSSVPEAQAVQTGNAE